MILCSSLYLYASMDCVCMCSVDWSISCSVVQINSVAQEHSIDSHLNTELSEPKQETTMLIEMREPGQIAWAHQEMIFNLLYARVHLFFSLSRSHSTAIFHKIHSISFGVLGAPSIFSKRKKKCTQLEIFFPIQMIYARLNQMQTPSCFLCLFLFHFDY